jgi:hypothetical protein
VPVLRRCCDVDRVGGESGRIGTEAVIRHFMTATRRVTALPPTRPWAAIDAHASAVKLEAKNARRPQAESGSIEGAIFA